MRADADARMREKDLALEAEKERFRAEAKDAEARIHAELAEENARWVEGQKRIMLVERENQRVEHERLLASAAADFKLKEEELLKRRDAVESRLRRREAEIQEEHRLKERASWKANRACWPRNGPPWTRCIPTGKNPCMSATFPWRRNSGFVGQKEALLKIETDQRLNEVLKAAAQSAEELKSRLQDEGRRLRKPPLKKTGWP